MNEKYIKLQIETVVNKLLFKKDIIEKDIYEETATRIDRLLFEQNKK